MSRILGVVSRVLTYCEYYSTCASSMGASTYAGLQKSFHISEEVAILTVSLYVLGLGVGPLFLGPTSEFVGRRIVYLWSLTGFLRKSV